jgi:uncharacterized membrane protein YjjP (DUF1212 family)
MGLDEERPLELLRFLSSLGHALLATGDTVARAEWALHRVARAYGIERVSVVALPTALWVKLDDEDQTRIDMTTAGRIALRFDQIAAVFALAEAGARRAITPAQGLERLQAILRQPPLYHTSWGIVGHALLTAGLAVILQPSPGVVSAAAVFGSIVGALKLFARGRGMLETLLPSVAAFLVTAISLFAVEQGFPARPSAVLIASLVTFLPGGVLAIAIMELAYGDVVSGGSRFVTGVAQLLFLALGMIVATSLVGLPPAQLFATVPAGQLGSWAPWLGVVLFAIGLALHYSMALPQVPWLFVVMCVARLAQLAGGAAFGGYMGGFCGALAMTPVAYFIQYRLAGPPALVTFPPGLWLLVPGSLGLIGLTELASDDHLAGMGDFFTTVMTITAIALGSMLGAGLYAALVDPFFARAGSLAQYWVGQRWLARRERPK